MGYVYQVTLFSPLREYWTGFGWSVDRRQAILMTEEEYKEHYNIYKFEKL